MSYLRHPIYVWQDSESIHFDDVAVPLEWFDAVVAMRWAQMSEAARDQAVTRALEYGELGADALRQSHGEETIMHSVFREVFGEEPQ